MAFVLLRDRALAMALLFTLLPGNASAGRCPGDCDGDGRVMIQELLKAVRMGLSGSADDECPALDADRSGDVSISEIIGAVAAAVGGCPPPILNATASPTMTVPPTPTPTSTKDTCTYDLMPPVARISGCSATVNDHLGSVSVVTNLATCCWRAESLNTVLQIVSASAGCGAGDIGYSVPPNTTSSELLGRIVLFEGTGFDNVSEFALQISRSCTRTPTPRATPGAHE